MKIIEILIDGIFEAPRIPADRKQDTSEILGLSLYRALGLVFAAFAIPAIFVIPFLTVYYCTWLFMRQ